MTDIFYVKSHTTPDKTYIVRTYKGGLRCNCPDFVFRGEPCKHITEIKKRREKDSGVDKRSGPIDYRERYKR